MTVNFPAADRAVLQLHERLRRERYAREMDNFMLLSINHATDSLDEIARNCDEIRTVIGGEIRELRGFVEDRWGKRLRGFVEDRWGKR